VSPFEYVAQKKLFEARRATISRLESDDHPAHD